MALCGVELTRTLLPKLLREVSGKFEMKEEVKPLLAKWREIFQAQRKPPAESKKSCEPRQPRPMESYSFKAPRQQRLTAFFGG